MTSRLFLAAFSGALLFFLSSSADASPLRLSVLTRPPTCPDSAALGELVTDAEPGATITGDANAPHAAVRIDRVGQRYRAAMKWKSDETRFAEGSDCHTVSKAVALMIAMKAAEEPAPEPAAPERVTPEPPPPVVIVATPPPAAPDVVEAKPEPARTDDGFSLGGTMRKGFVDAGWSPGITLGFTFRTKVGWPVSFTSGTTWVSDSDGFLRKELVASSLTGCPVGVRLDSVTLYACARGELGSNRVALLERGAKDGRELWLTAGPAAQVRVDIVPQLFVTAEAGAMYSMIEHNLVIEGPAFSGSVSFPRMRWTHPISISMGFAW